jgi:hypothetical protein
MTVSSVTATNTSGHLLLQKPFLTRPTVIPQFLDNKWTGKVFKIEQVLARSLDGGAKQHVWLAPDPRPHNHPWAWIDCKILRGSYTAMEYIPNGDGTFTEVTVTLRAGDPEHRLVHGAYHQIVEVEPGTITVMSFGPIVGDGRQWGNLVKNAEGVWVHDSNINIDGYLDVMRHFNPHLQPAGWVDPYAHLPVPTLEELLATVGL